MHPRDFEILDVAGIDLVETAVVIGLVGAVIGPPVILGRLGIQRRAPERARAKPSTRQPPPARRRHRDILEKPSASSLCDLFGGPKFSSCPWSVVASVPHRVRGFG